MRDDALELLLGSLDGPLRPSAAFEATLLQQLLDELETPAATTVPRAVPPSPLPPRRRLPRLNLRTAAALAGAAAAGAALVLVLQRPPSAGAQSALAAIRQAQEASVTAPPFEAEIVTRRPEGDIVTPDRTTRYVTEITRLAYAGDRRWRTDVLRGSASSGRPTGGATVRDGAYLGTYTPGAQATFSVRRARRADVGNDLIRPVGEALKVPEGVTFTAYFANRCTVLSDTRLVGRPARRIRCADGATRNDLWIDARTGLILKLSVPSVGYTLEVRRIAYGATFPRGTFRLATPAGARRVWEGPGVAPPAFRVAKPRRTAMRVVAAGRAPTDVAVGGGSAWVAVTGARRVLRVDAATLAPGPAAAVTGATALASGLGGIWVADERTGSLAHLDPDSGDLVARTDLGGDPQGLAAGEGAVWVADYEGGAGGDGTLVRVDPVTHAVAARIPVGAGPERVAVGQGAVWVTNSFEGTVSRVDPATNRAVARVRIAHGVPGSPELGLGDVAVGAGAVWVTQWSGGGAGTLVRIDPRTNRVTGSLRVGAGPHRVAVGGGLVWVSNAGDDTVVSVDPASRRIRATFRPGGGPGGVASGAGAAWVVNRAEGTLARIECAACR